MNAVKVRALPKPKHLDIVEPMPEPRQSSDIVIDVDADKLRLIEKVRTFDGDIKAFASQAKTITEHITEIIEGFAEYEEVNRLQALLVNAKADLKRRFESSSEYIKLTEELTDEKLSLKDAKEHISDFLLAYFHETGERQIELRPGNGREVVLKASLGKPKDIQTNLFSAPPDHLAEDDAE